MILQAHGKVAGRYDDSVPADQPSARVKCCCKGTFNIIPRVFCFGWCAWSYRIAKKQTREHQDRAVTLEDFVTMQEQSVRNVTDQLVERNKEVKMNDQRTVNVFRIPLNKLIM